MNIDDLKSELDQLRDEKYRLLKLVNHDIRSPFNRIFALLQLFEMESEEISQQQKEYIDSMYFSILSGLEMIQNLRDMREIDAGHIETEKSTFDLVKTIKKSIRTFSKQIELKRLKVEMHTPDESISITSDEYYAQRILENVLSNAIKFSPSGEKVEVELTKTNLGIEIKVRDFGDGIKQEEEHLLFQKFKKLSGVPTSGEGSLGLGLYNALYFLNKIGGSITLKRTENSDGSAFIISFPN